MEITGEQRRANEAGKHGNAVALDMDNWVKCMEAKLAEKFEDCQPSHSFTICRVPEDIRRVDDVAYNPLIVSFGPYHRGNSSLHAMEAAKWRNLKEIRRRVGKYFDEYLKAMKEIEPRARDCYAGKIDLTKDEFIEMMLLDGSFIIRLLLNRDDAGSFLFEHPQIHGNDKDPSYFINGMLCRVGHDMLLLENQLPFFVLECLWNLTGQRKRYALWRAAILFIQRSVMPFQHELNVNLLINIFAKEEKKKGKKEKKINPELNVRCFHHLLHLVYLFLTPTSLIKRESESKAKLPEVEMETLPFLPPRCHWFSSPSGKKFQFMECTRRLAAVIKKMNVPDFPFLSSCKPRNEPPQLTVIPCAAELDEAGVWFQFVKDKSFLDVKFDQGTMKMPCLSVQESTKSLFRNFIAFEQCFPNRGSHFTSYCNFMDYLVNTPRDVAILKKHAIIENCLGSDEEVARLFNDLCKGSFVSGLRSSYLKESSEEVSKHTQKICPRWRVMLKQEYFSSPWSIISVLAATFVIILTTVQTYYAVFS